MLRCSREVLRAAHAAVRLSHARLSSTAPQHDGPRLAPPLEPQRDRPRLAPTAPQHDDGPRLVPPLEPLPSADECDAPRPNPEHIQLRLVTDAHLRPGSEVWEQLSRHVASSFVEEWRRKFPKETHADHWQRSWEHTHAPLPSREAYWLIGYIPRESQPNVDPSDADSEAGVDHSGRELGDVVALTGLLVFRGSRSTATHVSVAQRAQARALSRSLQMPSLGIPNRAASHDEEDRVLAAALQAMAEATEEQAIVRKHSTPAAKQRPSNVFVPHVLLHTNTVLPSARGCGVGRRMVELALAWSRQQFVAEGETLEDLNEPNPHHTPYDPNPPFPAEMRLTVFDWNVAALRSIEAVAGVELERRITGVRGGDQLQFRASCSHELHVFECETRR